MGVFSVRLAVSQAPDAPTIIATFPQVYVGHRSSAIIRGLLEESTMLLRQWKYDSTGCMIRRLAETACYHNWRTVEGVGESESKWYERREPPESPHGLLESRGLPESYRLYHLNKWSNSDVEGSGGGALGRGGSGLWSQPSSFAVCSRQRSTSLTPGRSSGFSRQQCLTIPHNSSVNPRFSAPSGFGGR